MKRINYLKDCLTQKKIYVFLGEIKKSLGTRRDHELEGFIEETLKNNEKEWNVNVVVETVNILHRMNRDISHYLPTINARFEAMDTQSHVKTLHLLSKYKNKGSDLKQKYRLIIGKLIKSHKYNPHGLGVLLHSFAHTQERLSPIEEQMVFSAVEEYR